MDSRLQRVIRMTGSRTDAAAGLHQRMVVGEMSEVDARQHDALASGRPPDRVSPRPMAGSASGYPAHHEHSDREAACTHCVLKRAAAGLGMEPCTEPRVLRTIRLSASVIPSKTAPAEQDGARRARRRPAPLQEGSCGRTCSFPDSCPEPRVPRQAPAACRARTGRGRLRRCGRRACPT